MTYFTIFYFFLCYASGFASLIIFIVLYNKYKLIEIRKYLLFFMTLSYLVTIVITNFYWKSIFYLHFSKIYDFIFFTALLIGICLYIFSFPNFVQSVMQLSYIKRKYLIVLLYLPIVLYFLLHLISMLFKIKINVYKLSLYFAYTILIINIFYIFCYILYNFKSIKSPIRKKVLKLVLFFILLYSPFAIIDAFYFNFVFIFKNLPDGFSFAAPFYFIWNIVTLKYSCKYLTMSSINNKDSISLKKIIKYKITDREKEILNYIVNGCTNQEISDKAFISITTVKKHIYNLFQKTNAKNRVDLINILTK